MKAIWNGVVIAESDDTVVVEGNHYFPEAAVKREFLAHSNHRTGCARRLVHVVTLSRMPSCHQMTDSIGCSVFPCGSKAISPSGRSRSD